MAQSKAGEVTKQLVQKIHGLCCNAVVAKEVYIANDWQWLFLH